MKKLLLISILLCCSSAFAVDYWACASADAGAASEWDTVSAACSGTKLTYASRVSGAVFHTNSFTVAMTSATSGDIGANGAVALSNDNSAGSTAGGGFTCDTTAGPATMTLVSITAGSTATPALTISGSKSATANCAFSLSTGGTGGSLSGSNAVTDTHTVGTVTVTCTNALFTGGTVAGASGYNYSAATGSVDASTCNAKGGAGSSSYGFLLSSSGATGSIKNCVASDGSGGAAGCNAGGSSGSGALTFKGVLVSGKYSTAISQSKVYPAPSSTGSAVYFGTNASYASTDVVDGSGNVKAAASITYTNLYVFAAVYPTSGIGTGCTVGSPTACSNVLNGITFGPFTGSTASTGANSGSAN